MNFFGRQNIQSSMTFGGIIGREVSALTLCYWSIYIQERDLEEEAGSGDPTSLPWPIWKLSCDKDGGRNESSKAFENKCNFLYEINVFWIN